MSATVYYDNANSINVLSYTFTVNGVPTDPGAVSCVITDPAGGAITHTYAGTAPADITKVGTGVYTLAVPSVPSVAGVDGLWSFEWIGTAPAAQVVAGTWDVEPVTLAQYYTAAEELQERLGLSATANIQTQLLAVQAAASWINGHCGRHFYRITETRTFVPYNIYETPLDDLVSVTAVNLDFNGNGVYDTAWTQNVNYQLARGVDEFNALASGEPRPYTRARVINTAGAGNFFPFIWPFSHLDRVQVVGTWGWPVVPAAVRNASLQLAVELFKLKDAPFGIQGSADFGVIRIARSNPLIAGMLEPYRSSKRKVGV